MKKKKTDTPLKINTDFEKALKVVLLGKKEKDDKKDKEEVNKLDQEEDIKE
ncbi:hypothetical protein [Mucilaginibacter sp. OK098]|uniref:hypothetical protein n=1 Tax=Mucilaginibacter sp. OK098 TaxID=1855297 RepID=UPI000922A8CD|nr:hypothetical protein [Mucilaginibacter sp. OK098]SHM99061.1 hypothetical protein SAMN05216524_104448 [Mucilaginibacter sp. OK098]